jgi:hypothetical protein
MSRKEGHHLTPAHVAELLRTADGSNCAPLFALPVDTGLTSRVVHTRPVGAVAHTLAHNEGG